VARFWIRLRATEINLPLGELLIGRGPECSLRIDEPAVSRRHARLRIGIESVVLEDLNSRNGSRVNGGAVTHPVRLRAGDRIGIGTQEFTLECDQEAEGPARSTARLRAPEGAPTLTEGPRPRSSRPAMPAMQVPGTDSSATPSQGREGLREPTDPGVPQGISSGATSLGHCSRCGAPQGDASICPRCGHVYRNEFGESPVTTTRRSSSYKLFWALSDKVLHLGRVDEAERMMGPRLMDMLALAEGGDVPDEAAIGETLRRALRLAAATGKDRWFGWIFDYARVCRYPMPLVFLDELYAQMFSHRPSVGAQLLGYSRVLQEDMLILRLVTLRRLCGD
jgi:hypothetical protein